MQSAPSRPGAPLDGEGSAAPSAARRWLTVAAWLVGSLALLAIYVRISLTSKVNSDGSNNALQAWDLLHGHLLLHGWEIGDANFYFFELPLNAISQALFGLGAFATHAASALTYALVAVCAIALAVTDSRGTARVVRAAVVVMVLAGPLLTMSSLRLVLEEPDHIGTSVFLLVSFLLIDRLPERRFTAPLLCLVLAAGQFSDMTVRYVAVPAIVLVCGYRAIAARKLRTPDAAFVAAAVISVPLEELLRALFVHLGGFSEDAPRAKLAPVHLWAHQASVTWVNLRHLFGAVHQADTRAGVVAFAFATVCLAVAIAGLVRVVWVWRRASRAEQALFVAIIANVGLDTVSSLAHLGAPHELAVVLPCGAVLAARAVVPQRIARAWMAAAAAAVAGLAAILPLASAAVAPTNAAIMGPLTSLLEAHGLTYGIGGYWDASSAALQSGNRVQIRTVNLGKKVGDYTYIDGSGYEVNKSWYDPSLHNATFVVADPKWNYPRAVFERDFGKPAAVYHVQGWTVLVYRTNLLKLIGKAGYEAYLARGGAG